MQSRIKFTKMVGSGNDFVIIDNRDNILDSNLHAFAISICNRITGVGADGLIVLEKSELKDFTMRIFNSDGTEAEMCGNGARCVAYFAFEVGICSDRMEFETIAGVIEAYVTGDIVKVKMIDPYDIKDDVNIELPGLDAREVFSINTGVPHVVLILDDIEDLDIKRFGSSIRYDEIFAPLGTNVNFVKVTGNRNIAVRTYERGVEDETLSCGSGSTASAIAAGIKKGVESPVEVHTRSGEVLTIYFSINNAKDIYDVYLEGKVKKVFEGFLN